MADVGCGKPLRIGIALSGGGSRAMAFHLGCLRTLHRVGILDQARVLSTVSGGTVIGAMYAVHDGSFESFEHWVRATLQAGFVRPALKTALTTPEAAKALIAFCLLSFTSLLLLPLRLLGRVIGWLGGARQPIFPEGWMPRRFASRSTILRRTFDRLLFRGRCLDSLQSRKPKLIAVAAELRTASAFYFGTEEAGSWRFGKANAADVPIAHAVAASAAYPLFLPALDEYIKFRKRDGSLARERVTLTDGGVYDNLGLAPLWPDRDSDVSVQVEPVDAIIACRAGYGLRTNPPSLFLGSRLRAVFGCASGRAQNLSMKRLFDLKEDGRIAAFALPYIDQADEKLAFAPPDLVPRESVADYPTDFSAMTPEWIDKLSKRGEQLTLAVIREHAPELLQYPGRREAEQPAPSTTCRGDSVTNLAVTGRSWC